jgi:glycine/D-amino acid oxidase-like deaminating enzyme/nitrite reductase/ring-hydroxylating ferredoxin subunit
MASDSGNTLSLWMTRTELAAHPELTEDERADLCVVGAGIAGLTTAYHAAAEGRSVVVLDDGPIAGGETCRTSAHLSNVIDDRFQSLERVLGEGGARDAQRSHADAIERIERIVTLERLDCDFERVDGYLFLAPGQESELLSREEEAAVRAEFPGLQRLARAPLPFDTGPCLRFPRQAQFDPLRYLAGLVDAIQRMGGRLRSRSHVVAVEGGTDARVRTSAGREVRAEAIVVATNSPVNDRFKIHTKQAPYRTYVIAAGVPRGTLIRALYWDMAEPYHYVRLAQGARGAEHEMLLVGGEDHKTGQEQDPAHRHDALERWMRERFPLAGPIELRWSGQVLETMDGLAHIGPNPLDHDNVFVATGDSGMGMTHGTLAGMILADLSAGRENRWASLYDPSRKSLRNTGHFLKENLNVAAQYVRDYATPGEIASADMIAPGSGAILRHGLTKVAAHRDAAGRLHELSAVCPHLGCIVHWNRVEKTWDCPCHGSRFAAEGRVINGPANRDLAPAEHHAAT